MKGSPGGGSKRSSDADRTAGTRCMKVLLFNPPGDRPYLRDYYCSSISKSGYYWHPIDLLVLSALLPQSVFTLSVLDAIAERKDGASCRDLVRKLDPDSIIFLTGATSWASDVQILRGINDEKPRRMIGCGEVFLGDTSRLFEEQPWMEAGIVDFTDPEIPAYLTDYRPTHGVVTKDGSGPRPARIREPKQGKSTSFRYGVPRYELFPMRRYHYPWSRHHPFASVLTTYGCPHPCTFCNSGSLGFKVRMIEDVLEELTFIKAMRIRQIFVKDMSFGSHRPHALEFCNALEDRKFTFSWNCYARIDTLDNDMLSIMKRTGCHLIQFGVETADEAVAKKVGKPFSLSRVFEVFGQCRALGIRTGAHFIMGLPGETESSLGKTVHLACQLNPDYVSFNIFMPRYGTLLMRRLEAEGRIPVSAQMSLDPSETFPLSRVGEISPQTLFVMRNRAYRVFYLRPWYLARQVIKVRTRYEVRSLVVNGWGLLKNQIRMRLRFTPRHYREIERA